MSKTELNLASPNVVVNDHCGRTRFVQSFFKKELDVVQDSWCTHQGTKRVLLSGSADLVNGYEKLGGSNP